MRKIAFIPMLVIAVLFLNACMPVQDPATMQAEVERITLEEAKQHFDNGTALFVDARAESDYDQAHIANAIRLSADQIATLGETLPKDQLMITYCT